MVLNLKSRLCFRGLASWLAFLDKEKWTFIFSPQKILVSALASGQISVEASVAGVGILTAHPFHEVRGEWWGWGVAASSPLSCRLL